MEQYIVNSSKISFLGTFSKATEIFFQQPSKNMKKWVHPFPRFSCRPVPKVLPLERKKNPQKSDIKI
jgi:hypothetical protein